MRVRYSLTLEEAERMVHAGQKHARANEWPITIAIVDDSGFPILVSRLDEATPASVTTAIEKARSAALTGLPTKMLEAVISERPAVATLGRVAVEGGVPILHCGQRLGGIGVSGVRSDQDAMVAQTALEAVGLVTPAP
jgi:glc operon protein GlcG